MDHLRTQHPNTTVSVLRVVPPKEKPAELHRMLCRAKSIRELRMILQRLELALRIGIIIRHMRPAVGFVYPQRDKELRGALGYHGRPMVRMNGQLPRLYPLLSAAFPFVMSQLQTSLGP